MHVHFIYIYIVFISCFPVIPMPILQRRDDGMKYCKLAGTYEHDTTETRTSTSESSGNMGTKDSISICHYQRSHSLTKISKDF